MGSFGWTLIQNDWCPYKKWKIGHKENTMEYDNGRDQGDASASQGIPTCAYKLPEARGQVWGNRFSFNSPQKEPPLLTAWSQISSLQNCGTLNFCCLSHPIYDTVWWQPHSKTERLQLWVMRRTGGWPWEWGDQRARSLEKRSWCKGQGLWGLPVSEGIERSEHQSGWQWGRSQNLKKEGKVTQRLIDNSGGHGGWTSLSAWDSKLREFQEEWFESNPEE